MLSCKEVVTLHASDAARTASMLTRMGYRVHRMMCRHCSRYVRELDRIRAATRSLYADTPVSEGFLVRVLKAIEERPSA